MARSSAGDVSLDTAPCVCGALRRATRAMIRHYDAYLVPAGTTIARYSLLETLRRLGSPTLAAYAEDLVMERTTLLRNLRPLVDERLVSVRRAPRGRANVARLTARGARALADARPHWRAAQTALAGRVSRNDVDHLVALTAALG